jgi:methylglutaconyl-CoA hydratase
MAYGGCNMIQTNLNQDILWITLNRVEKHNAFCTPLLQSLDQCLKEAIENPQVKVLILKAQGRFFSAGADLLEMQQASQLPLSENIAHARLLADVLERWHSCCKPTLTIVQGAAFGGALGFIAASDVAIACPEAKFCFSEAKLGLIPAMISPYILKSMGLKATKKLFLSAETFDSNQALGHQLIDYIVPHEQLESFASQYVQQWLNVPQEALTNIKQWLYKIDSLPIDEKLIQLSAETLASIRSSSEAQKRLQDFIHSKTT